MKTENEDEFAALQAGGRRKVPVCLMTRIAFYGCLGLALVTLGIFIVTNLKGQ